MPGGKLLRGRYVLTGAGRTGAKVIEDGAVAVDGAAIREVGPAMELTARYPDWEVIGSERHVVLPGLVNSHHHGYGLTSFELGIPDDSLESWLVDVRAAAYPIDPYWDTLRSITRLIRAGVTTVLHVGSPRLPWDVESAARKSLQAYRDAGMRVAYAIGVMDQNRFVYEDDDDFLSTLPEALVKKLRLTFTDPHVLSPADVLELAMTLHEEHAGDPMVRILLCPMGPQWCSDGLLSRVGEVAASLGLGIHTHCLESPHQREYADRAYPEGTLARLQRLGIVGPRVSLAHGVWLTRSDIEVCAVTGTSVCHNASSNLRLRAGIMPATTLLEAGVNIAIGTDSMSLNEDDDMFQEMRLVEAIHRLPRRSQPAPPLGFSEVLAMATVNGALPTTFADLGALEQGRVADAVLLVADPSLDRLIEAGVTVEDAMLRWARSTRVDTVLLAGEAVLSDSRFAHLDEDLILRELLASAEGSPDRRSRRWADVMRELKPHIQAFYDDEVPAAPHPSYSVNSPS